MMSYCPLTWASMTVSLLSAGVYLIVRPSCLNRPSYSATKNPAESTEGTAATFSVVASSGPIAAGLSELPAMIREEVC